VTRRTVDVLLQMPGRAADGWRDALAEALPEAVIAVWPDGPSDPEYACVWRPPDELFVRVQPTKAIFNLGAGVDALLAVPTLPRDVPVVRLEDAGMAEQMAEYAALAVLRAYRETDVYAAQQGEARWHPRERLTKTGFGVGLLGCGVLGRAIAAALTPFGFPLAGWSRTRKVPPGVAAYGPDEFASFLAASHALVCTLPLTPATTGLLDRAALSQLPRGAHLINMARGEIIVDADLLEILDEGHLASATLDVFRVEPLPPEHAFWHHPAITVTPHVSAVTLIPESVAQVAAKIRRFERGEAVSGIVDRDRGY
jgi:glyoxylate/hydroxypyruvate reductase